MLLIANLDTARAKAYSDNLDRCYAILLTTEFTYQAIHKATCVDSTALLVVERNANLREYHTVVRSC